MISNHIYLDFNASTPIAPEVADGSLRLSLGKETQEADIQQAAEAIIDVVTREKLRQVA